MVGENNQNVFLIKKDASIFAEFEISEFEISRFDCSLDPAETSRSLFATDNNGTIIFESESVKVKVTDQGQSLCLRSE